jgi:hypothetical protein
MIADLDVRVRTALRTEEPELALRDVVRAMIEEGHRRAEVVQALEDYRERIHPDEDADELLLDVMAVLGGWASTTAVRNLLPPPCVAPHASALS